ncbi:trimethyltridecatetraene synthase-like [Salvia splendens]|uniref:trimethyltridecatetraene synthase-like n=1 Tax=Salvia splendens TaxID=180675 RepID=UPI001100D460|nr:trimethyltridecatetraene synthase-like [Salvia splendens]
MPNNLESLLALILIAALALLSRRLPKRPSQRKLPPGPRPWPIIGNMNLLGSSPHRSLHSLSQKYGDLMLIKLGTSIVLVASSAEMAEQFLKVHDANFATRPALAAGKYTAYNYSDMTWAPYGPYWRQARKIFSEVLNTKSLEFFKPIRVEEGRSFLSRLHALSGKPVVLREHLSHYTLSNISRMVLSNKCFSEEEEEDGRHNSIFKLGELQAMLDEGFLLNGVINIGDWIPWLSFLDLQGYVKRMKELYKKLDMFNEFVINDHEARRAAENDFFTFKDAVDMLLEMAKNPNLEVKMTRDCIKGLLQDLLSGGTDTSAASIEWAIHEVLRHPQVAEKVKKELDMVIGRNRWVEESDYLQLPYINAIIMETWRLHPLSPLLPPHCAIEDCKVAGYDIPKGTPVIINTWSIGRNPNLWDKPEEFLPERFLGKDIDMTGSDFSLLPFSSGRRRCPGYKLGLKLVQTTLANLLHGFDMRLVEGMGPQDICLEELYGLTVHPKESLEIIMEPKLAPHLY